MATRRPRAPRNSLTREAIVDAAVAVLDEGGPARLTMRSLAERLGVRPMALYTYVGSKDELLDAARDHILGGLSAQDDAAHLGAGAAGAEHTGPDWVHRLRSAGLGLYRLLVAHPALIHLFATRPLAGHEAAGATEEHLRVLREAGFATVRPDGARRLYAVRAEPLRDVDAWLDRFRRFWAPHLDALGTELVRGRRRRREEHS
jgi:AcrR family transcriptional regulator